MIWKNNVTVFRKMPAHIQRYLDEDIIVRYVFVSINYVITALSVFTHTLFGHKLSTLLNIYGPCTMRILPPHIKSTLLADNTLCLLTPEAPGCY